MGRKSTTQTRGLTPMQSCPFLHLEKGAFQSSLIRNLIVKLPGFFLVSTGQINLELVSWARVCKLLEVHRSQKRSHGGSQRCLIKLRVDCNITPLRNFDHRCYSVLEQGFFPSLWQVTALWRVFCNGLSMKNSYEAVCLH